MISKEERARIDPQGSDQRPAGDWRRSKDEPLLITATAVISILNYAYTLIMVWLLPPTKYVVVGSISSVLLVWGTVAGAAVPWVLAREIAQSPGDAPRRQKAVCFSVFATLAQAAGAGLVTCIIALRYADSLVLGASFTAVYAIFAASTVAGYLQGMQRFKVIAALRVGEVLFKIAVGATLVALGAGSAGGVLGFAVGGAAVIVGGFGFMRKDWVWVPGAITDRSLWRSMGGLLAIQSGVAVLASLDVIVGSLILGKSVGFATYQAANILGRVPLYIGTALSLIVYPRLAAPRERPEVEINRSLWIFVRVCVPAAFVTMTVPKQIVDIVFPHSYSGVAGILPWVAVGGLSLGCANLVTTFFQAANDIRRPTITLTIGICAGIALDVLGVHCYGVRGLGGAVATQGVLVSGSLLRDAHRRWSNCLAGLPRSLIAAGLLSAPLFLLRSSPGLWLLAMAIFAGLPALLACFRIGAPSGLGRPRILHLGFEDHARPGSGGGAVRTHEINRRLASTFSITVVCASYPGARTRVEDGVRYVHTGIRSLTHLSSLSYFALMPFVLWRYDSDLVVEDFAAPFSSVAVPWLTRRPVIGVVQWLFAREKSRQYRVPFFLVEAAGLRSHKRLIAVSDELGSRLRSISRAEVAVVPNGLGDGVSSMEEAGRNGIRYLGRLENAQKGLDLLLEAFALISKRVSQDVLIGGDGPDLEELSKLAAGLGIADRVHFVGRIDANARFEWLGQAELLAMPSRYETFGMVAAESLAVETPVVSFDIPCLRGLVDGETGRLVEPFDVRAYAAAMEELLRDPLLRRELGRAGPRKVAHLRWETLAEEQGALYSAALRTGSFGTGYARTRIEPSCDGR